MDSEKAAAPAPVLSYASASPSTSKAARVIGWILSALPILLMLGGGIFSLFNPAMIKEGMSKYGYPEGSGTILVIVEIVCALLYLLPQTAVLGAILLTGYLGGATATHVRAGEPFFFPILVGVIVWLGLFLRDPRVRALVPLRK